MYYKIKSSSSRYKKINDDELKKLGAKGILKVGEEEVQAIFGTHSEILKDEIKTLLNYKN
jgi:phosphotransferase system IIB component